MKMRGSDWEETRERVLARDSGYCQVCGKPAKHVHHIAPFARVRGHEDPNLISLCPGCHLNAHLGKVSADALRAILRRRGLVYEEKQSEELR